MHRCLKCGRTVVSVNEIAEGCACGSKVFVFHRLPSQEEETAPPAPPHITLIPSIGDETPLPKTNGPGNHAVIQPVPSQTAPTPAIFSPVKDDSPSTPEQASHFQPPSPAAVASSIIAADADDGLDADSPYSEVWLTKGGRIEPLEDGAVPITSAHDASMGALPGAVEVANVRQLRRGVYEIDVGRLQGEPLVVQDSQGIYYVRLPFAPLPTEMPEKKE